MSTGDYVLWFGSLFILLVMGSMIMGFIKERMGETWDWVPAFFGCVFYLVLAGVVLGPTYYLIVMG